jgi:hypothetical protein
MHGLALLRFPEKSHEFNDSSAERDLHLKASMHRRQEVANQLLKIFPKQASLFANFTANHIYSHLHKHENCVTTQMRVK